MINRSVLFIFLVLLSMPVLAQVADSAIRPMLRDRMYDCFEVEYNAISLLPELYGDQKMDTFDALISFWKRHCEDNERVFSISVLNEIRKNTFTEYIASSGIFGRSQQKTAADSDIYKPRILYNMEEYKAACKGAYSDKQYGIWFRNSYPLPADYASYYNFYKGYYSFLRKMAADLQGKRTYSPLENYLLQFYARPDSVKYQTLDSVAFAGTILHKKYTGYQKFHNDMHGLSVFAQLGSWMPTGNLKILGSHPYFSFGIGGRSEHIIVDYIFGFRFGSPANNYLVRMRDSVYNSDNFSSWFTGFDFGTKIFRTKKSELDVLWGVGYEEIQTLYVIYEDFKPAGGDEIVTQSAKSFYANAGLGYKFYLRDVVIKNRHKRSYLSLQAKYNYMHYNNSGGTDLTGNSFIFGLVYGSYSFSYIRYPYLKD